MAITIRELNSTELATIYPLVKLLNPDLTKPQFLGRLKAMLPLDYRAVAIYDGKRMIACSGFWIGVRFWCGRLLDIDNFVVHPDYRAKRVGRRMLDWLEKKAFEEKAEALVLDAYVTNTQAHRFYHRAGFGITGYHFTKTPGRQEPLVPKRFR